ncbi:SDR family oxidoreductase [Flavihumibacter petaseus]|uniref:NAD-dependent epimerase/dehydratase family protein n=1 Tax=Flavihumibacter petaseus NBRC 106054 TaxID=1220578 RepID=A0A0E9MZ03_9BACT|nr:SDR family oxidoreductase [Flavihumibacter petaseus]GAO42340.1 NAD-dependent epimerase/dehydratase family protein [Flavihumibacter petaseus NBRC 106054]
MTILLTGATGYIGQRLIPVLLDGGHTLYCLVRDCNRLDISRYDSDRIHLVEGDLLQPDSLAAIPDSLDAAYYLVHSMTSKGNFEEKETASARHFIQRLQETTVRQIIYLGGIANAQQLSPHLSSRKKVEAVLRTGHIPVTVLRAGIIVGSGSASFEIIRDLVEKLPVMITPKWLRTRTQPVAIRNVLEFLSGVLLLEQTYHQTYDLYGPDLLSYKDMLLLYARERGLQRYILTLPVMTPRLSSYWLYFVTSTTYQLAQHLVDSMKVETIAIPNDLAQQLDIRPIGYRESIRMAFDKIEQDMVLSTWKDAFTFSRITDHLSTHIQIPEYGCFKDHREMRTENPALSADRIFAIGGASGWYYADWLWAFRGLLDKLFGGVGLTRGRKNKTQLIAGESLDFWRVLYANRAEKRLLLYAEMKLPGEAWLEFNISDQGIVSQTATFRPLGVAGRLYWLAVLPFHHFIFRGMLRKIVDRG